MFEEDLYPGKPKILFIGHPSSSHTISWIDLLKGEDFNVRLFSLPTGLPPDDWKVKTYLTVPELPSGLDIETRLWFYPRPEEKAEIRTVALSLEAMRQNLIRQENLLRMDARQAMKHQYEELSKSLQLHYDELSKSLELQYNDINKLLQKYHQQESQQTRSLYNSLSELLRENTFSYKLGKTLQQFKITSKGFLRKDSKENTTESDTVSALQNSGINLDENNLSEQFIDKENITDSENVNSKNSVLDEKEPGISDFIPSQPQVVYDTRFPTLEDWLASIIQQWQPDIIHTLGLDPAGFFYNKVRKHHHLEGTGKWVLQLRGGSDLTLSRFDHDRLEQIVNTIQESDCILSDNLVNISYAHEMGIDPGRFASICPVPGTGGIDINELTQSWAGDPSTRRDIIWPKAYDSPWSLALPVIEALKIAWDDLKPCEVHILATTPEVRMWLKALPVEILDHCHIYDRIDRLQVHNIMAASRIMLAPSIVDGVPNTLYEAMASGAFPIVSPLITITPVVQAEENVLFARNLYPDEIAHALKRAMTENMLVDKAAERNLHLVRKLANREIIKPKVIDLYNQMTSPILNA